VGRPTREQQALRHEELLEAALDAFLEKGFELATVEEIAARTAMSKRTVYARYADKQALFVAAVERAVRRYRVPREAVEAVVTDDLEQSLAAIARLRLENLAAPSAVKLQRILLTQSYRFPELYRASIDEFLGPTLQVLYDLFERHRAELVVPQPRRAAGAFIGLAVGGTARGMVSGIEDAVTDEVEERIRFAVRLFLDGVRKR
jgi:AcrR family transcriptional regulator